MGVARRHGPLRREQGLDNWVASLARMQLVAQVIVRESRGELCPVKSACPILH